MNVPYTNNDSGQSVRGVIEPSTTTIDLNNLVTRIEALENNNN